MYVQTNMDGAHSAGSYAPSAILEIPKELYNPLVMTRLGPNLTPDQQAALVLWATANPGAPAINRE